MKRKGYIDNEMYEDLLSKNIYIFGAGNRGKKLYNRLVKEGFVVKAFFDSNKKDIDASLFEIDVLEPELVINSVVILSPLNHYDEIAVKLVNLGYSLSALYTYENVIIFLDEMNLLPEEYPKTIQFPITYRCNFNCVMCGMNQLITNRDMNVSELYAVLSDRQYQCIEAVGINGGEPFLNENIVEFFDVMVNRLPKLQDFYIISNGYFTEKILNSLKNIRLHVPDNIKLHLSLSLDGIGLTQDISRGKKGAYDHLIKTFKCINEDINQYVDDLDIICTVTTVNIDKLYEVEDWAEKNGVTVAYGLAVENERLSNQDKIENVIVSKDLDCKMKAIEFFYGMYRKTGNKKYFGIYLYLKNGRRYTLCPHMHNKWTTLLPDGDVTYCAVRGKKLGSAISRSAYEIIGANREYEEELMQQYCVKCAHYGYTLSAEGYSELFRDNIKNSVYNWRGWE